MPAEPAELNWVEWLFAPWAEPAPKWRKVKQCKRKAIDRILAVPPETASLTLFRERCRRCGKCDMAANHPAWPTRDGPMLTGW